MRTAFTVLMILSFTCTFGCRSSDESTRSESDGSREPAVEPGRSAIRVEATGFRNAKGKALIRLFRGKEGFPGQAAKAFRKTEVDIVEGRATATFENLPAGAYGLSLAHDEDGNGKMTYNAFGIPLEGSGTSGKPSGGRPRFEKARFVVEEGKEYAFEIRMKYFG